MKLVVDVTSEDLEALKALDEHGRVERVLAELVERVRDGVCRPGSWERAWLQQAFGYEWMHRLEPDPDTAWRERPRKRRGA